MTAQNDSAQQSEVALDNLQATVRAGIEALLFVCADPVSFDELASALNVTNMEITQALIDLKTEYQRQGRGILLRFINDKAQLCTNPACAGIIERHLQPEKTKSFSQSVIETLSVIAYRQPVTRAHIEQIRGVRCEYSVGQLLRLDFIEQVGRVDAVGRPALYGTTEKFLQFFNIESIEQLPMCEAILQLAEEEPLAPLETV